MKHLVVILLLLFNNNVVGQIKIDDVGDGWGIKVNQAINLIKQIFANI